MAWYSMEEMAEILKECPPSDPNMNEIIYHNVIREGYLLYDGKRNKAACTRCGYVWDIAPGEYSGCSHSADRCPCCESDLTCLSAGRGRMRFGEYHRVMSFAEKDGTLWAILNELMPVFDNFGRPDLHSKIRAVYKLNASEQRYWKLIEPWGSKPYYTEPANITIPSPPGAIYGYSKYEDHLYAEGLKDMILRSDCKYLYEDWMISDPKMWMVPYMASELKYHSVELLRKAGFLSIANIKLKGYGGARCINWRANSLERILKLPKRWVRFLREYDPSVGELEIFQHMTEEEKRAGGRKVATDIAHSYRDEKRYREVVEEYMPFIKWIKYADGQEARYKGHLLSDYEDYMRIAASLGMDISKNSVKFPKDLKTAHDAVNAQWKAAKDEIKEKAIAAKARLISDYIRNDLMIIAATSQEDLNKESAGLCHCVKTYGDKIARGDCWIFFIRDIRNPDRPFYTLETTTEGKMVQCRGLHNCSMTEEVKIFTEAFVKDLQKQIGIERRQKLCQTA